jgi:hypothetical protein
MVSHAFEVAGRSDSAASNMPGSKNSVGLIPLDAVIAGSISKTEQIGQWIGMSVRRDRPRPQAERRKRPGNPNQAEHTKRPACLGVAQPTIRMPQSGAMAGSELLLDICKVTVRYTSGSQISAERS